jgi:hypothetical protein
LLLVEQKIGRSLKRDGEALLDPTGRVRPNLMIVDQVEERVLRVESRANEVTLLGGGTNMMDRGSKKPGLAANRKDRGNNNPGGVLSEPSVGAIYLDDQDLRKANYFTEDHGDRTPAFGAVVVHLPLAGKDGVKRVSETAGRGRETEGNGIGDSPLILASEALEMARSRDAGGGMNSRISVTAALPETGGVTLFGI